MAQRTCGQCGQKTSSYEPNCQHCGAELKSAPLEKGGKLGFGSILAGPTILGSAGALILAAGIFLPFVQMPLLGSVNYFLDGEINGWILLAIAGAALVCSLIGQYRPAGYFGLAAGGYIGWDVWDVMNIQSYIDTEMQGDPMQGLVKEMADSLQFEYGLYVLIAGVLTIFAGAAWGIYIQDKNKKKLLATVDKVTPEKSDS